MHRHLDQCSAQKLVNLVCDASVDDKNLEKALSYVTKNFDTCAKFKKLNPHLIVALPMTNTFNDFVAMDLKSYGSALFSDD